MTKDLTPYIQLTEFLGAVLGPNYEITLFEITDDNPTLLAIANGHISDRSVNSPLSRIERKWLEEKTYLNSRTILHDVNSADVYGITLRSSASVIENAFNQPAGMLCVHFSDKAYRELSDHIVRLCHPSEFLERALRASEALQSQPQAENSAEKIQESIQLTTEQAIAEIAQESGAPVSRLTLNEKMRIISVLDAKGIFLMKNAVKIVSKQLYCSQASIYRYLGKLKQSPRPES